MPHIQHPIAALAVAIATVLSLAACEGAAHDSPADAGDAGTDAGAQDAGDSGIDAEIDATLDLDAGHDAGHDASAEDAMIDPCALGCPAGAYDVDGNPLTGTCGCEYACVLASASDPYDAAFTDDNCDGGDGVVDSCVYVSASQGLDAQPGTRALPMQTIAAALQQAQTNFVPFVCVSAEVYTEVFTVPSGVGLIGGFDHQDPDFKFRRKAGVTTTVNGSTLP